MRIGLLSCTKSKQVYRCKASEMYAASPRFRLAYQYAKMTCDQIFILSAKYGLLSEDDVIDPYDLSLYDLNPFEMRQWTQTVTTKLQNACSLDEDIFIILTGEKYYTSFLPRLRKSYIPLKGVKFGNWIPELKQLIEQVSHDDVESICVDLHRYVNSLPRLTWQDIDQIKFQNGIYIMFEKGETYKNWDRIVRVGTHTSDNRLIERLRDHFFRENKDGSILRKNIGLAILAVAGDDYLKSWNLDTSKSENREQYHLQINCGKQREIEHQVTKYLRDKFSFVCIEIDDKRLRLQTEEKMISTLVQCKACKSSTNWLGINNPKQPIASGGLWNIQGANGQPMTVLEIELLRNGMINTDHSGHTAHTIFSPRPTKIKPEKVDNLKSSISTADVYRYIMEIISKANKQGHQHIDIKSGTIHQNLGLNNRMPMVCSAMWQLKSNSDEVIRSSPSGKTSALIIRYATDTVDRSSRRW